MSVVVFLVRRWRCWCGGCVAGVAGVAGVSLLVFVCLSSSVECCCFAFPFSHLCFVAFNVKELLALSLFAFSMSLSLTLTLMSLTLTLFVDKELTFNTTTLPLSLTLTLMSLPTMSRLSSRTALLLSMSLSQLFVNIMIVFSQQLLKIKYLWVYIREPRSPYVIVRSYV